MDRIKNPNEIKYLKVPTYEFYFYIALRRGAPAQMMQPRLCQTFIFHEKEKDIKRESRKEIKKERGISGQRNRKKT
jgi:hypothetical protein